MIKINLLFLLFFPVLSFAGINTYEKNYINENLQIIVNSDIKINHNYLNKIFKIIDKASSTEEFKNRIQSIKIYLFIKKNSKKISFSNANSHTCKITLNYDDKLDGSLVNKLTDDILFTYYHEASHCFLGKDIFLSGLKWQTIDADKQTLYNNKIQKQTNLATINVQCNKNCLSVDLFKLAPPLIVYHEIYADMMAFYFFSRYDCYKTNNLFSQIETIRLNNYWAKPKSTTHQSFRAFNYIEKRNFCIDPISIEDVSNLTEKGFLDYLNTLE